MTKKSSEIIVEMQEQIKHLTKIISNQDNNIKLIIKKLNALQPKQVQTHANVEPVSSVDVPISAQTTNTTTAAATNSSSGKVERKFVEGQESIAMKIAHAKQANKNSEFEAMAAQAGVDVNNTLVNQARQNQSIPIKQDNVTVSEEKSFKGTRRGVRVDRTPSNKNVTVTQQLLDSSNKILPLATVKITDSNGDVVKSTRSNTKGKWTAPLKEGNYNIHVLRKFAKDPNKTPVEMRYSILVSNNDGEVLELEPMIEGKVQ